MSALALPHGGEVPHRTHRLVLVAAAVLLVAAFLAAVVGREPDDLVPVATPTPAPPTDAIEHWLAANREDVFPGAAGGYLGTCPTDGPGYTVGLCSALVEDLGDVQIHLVGAYATDWGADLLLERTVDGWRVAEVAPWPELGVRHDGPPWSPLTAVTGWWADQGAIHLRSCDDAVGAATGQELRCSTLVEADGARRVYDSGVAGAPAEVRVTVVRQADRTWAVDDVRPLPPS
jgi:hypothetical protein